MPGQHTIIAAFSNYEDAHAALEDLQSAGISRNDMDLENGSNSSASSNKTSTGGFTGWVKSIFSEHDDSDRRRYESAIGSGASLLRVDLDDSQITSVEAILNRHSPLDLHADSDASHSAGAETIPVVQEEVQVGKRQVLRGGVRVYSRIVDKPVEESVRLREEHVRVDRTPANRAATEADLAIGRDQVIEVQEFAEQPVVSKQSRVVEEVHVGKDVTERTETIRENVRNTEVNVERLPANGSPVSERAYAASDDSDFRTHFQRRFADSGDRYDAYSPAYEYGNVMASDPRYSGRSFDDVESDLRSDYGRRYPQSSWDRTKDAVRYGWDRVTGKTAAAVR